MMFLKHFKLSFSLSHKREKELNSATASLILINWLGGEQIYPDARLTELTTRNLTPIPLPIIVKRLNQSLRSWSCYFDYANSTKVFGDVKRHAEERLRTHLRKRHKVKARRIGQGRFLNQVLYERCGLYKLPTTADRMWA